MLIMFSMRARFPVRLTRVRRGRFVCLMLIIVRLLSPATLLICIPIVMSRLRMAELLLRRCLTMRLVSIMCLRVLVNEMRLKGLAFPGYAGYIVSYVVPGMLSAEDSSVVNEAECYDVCAYASSGYDYGSAAVTTGEGVYE